MDKVHFETSGSLGIRTLANPPINLLSGELIADLRAAVTDLKRAPLRALLARAEGKVFSAGADVSAFKGKTGSDAKESFTTHLRMIADLEELPFPTLAAVQGMCVGLIREHAVSAVVVFLKDEWLNSMRFAQSRGLPYISLSSGSFEIGPEVAQYIHALERSPVLLASHWLAGASLYPALHYANAFRSIDEVRIGVLLDEEDIGGPAAHARPVWIGEL